MLRYLRLERAAASRWMPFAIVLGGVVAVACAPVDPVEEPAPAATQEAAEQVAETPDTAAPVEETPASNTPLKTNQAGLDIIKEAEGLRLEAYLEGSTWLIGYGHSRTAKEGMTITEAEAEQLLREDLLVTEQAVARIVTVPLNENQFSALVSLCYNIGARNFERSTVVAALNQGDYQGAADAFPNHARARVEGELVQLPGLVARRAKERDLFLKPVQMALREQG